MLLERVLNGPSVGQTRALELVVLKSEEVRFGCRSEREGARGACAAFSSEELRDLEHLCEP